MTGRVGKAGEAVGSYQLEEWLGGGGNADVWRAVGPHGQVAVKLLRQRRPDSEPYRRFRREVQQLLALGDVPGVLPLLDAHLPEEASVGQRPWLVTPVAHPLRQALGEFATVEDLVGSLAGVAETLAALHERGVAHRDVKPENLFVLNAQVVVGDFGLVDAPDVEPLTVAGGALGPRHYLAPEMLADPVRADGKPADVYSLAKTAWALLAGQRYPPPGEHRPDVDSLRLTSYLAHPRADTLDVLLDAATRHEPSARPPMARVARELRSWLAPPGQQATPGDLSGWAREAAAAGAAVVGAEERYLRLRQQVDDALLEFTRRARAVHQSCLSAGLPVYSPAYAVGTGFETDASEHLEGLVGPLATRQALGSDPPASRAVGLLLQQHERLPGLKLWVGVTCLRGRPQATLGAGSSLVGLVGDSRVLWRDQRQALLAGPSMALAMDELIALLNSRLEKDLEAWVGEMRRARRETGLGPRPTGRRPRR